MSDIKRVIIAALIVVGLTVPAYAAVRLASETEYGVSASQTGIKAPTPRPNVCEETPCPIGYNVSSACELHNPTEGRICKYASSCCNEAGVMVLMNECPSDYPYTVLDISTVYDLSNREYCTGYKNGILGNYFLENPQSCSMQGITSESYLSELSSSSNCGTARNMTPSTCTKSDGAGGTETLNICILNSIDGYSECPAGDDSYSPYPFNSCGEAGNEAANPCYTKCGDSRNCIGFTCSISMLPNCTELEDQKIAEGYYSSGISTTETADIYWQCLDGGVVKYLGFFCQNYLEQSDCESAAKNGTIGETCSIKKADGLTQDVYTCSCGNTYKTLEQFCADKDEDCMSEYYPADDALMCTLDKDASGNTLNKYNKFVNTISLCSKLTTVKYIDEPADGCPLYDDEPEPDIDICRVNSPSGGWIEKDICKYCEGFVTEEEAVARAMCGAGEPVVCHWKNDSVVYMNECECDDSVWKTIEELCATEPYSSDENCLITATGKGEACRTNPVPGSGTEALYKELTCQSQFKTKEEWCDENPNAAPDGFDCKKDFIGQGVACSLDAEDPADESQWKYAVYVLGCPTGADTTAKATEAECLLPSEDKAFYTKCAKWDENQEKYTTRYICKCPENYGTTCTKAYEVRGGTACNFDTNTQGSTITKYAKCQISCGHAYASMFAPTAYDCESIDTYVSTIRGGVEDPKMCVMAGDRSEKFICGCPSNFVTIDDWCAANYATEGLSDVSECIQGYTGRGTVCQLDVEEDTGGNPARVLTKYAYYIRNCPTDRPLYYSEDDCRYVGGEYSYSCRDAQDNERVVCSCPTNWYNSDGSTDNVDIQTCLSTTVNSSYTDEEGNTVQQTIYGREASGEYCDFDGSDTLKYKECVVKCSEVLKDTSVAKENAYVYLSSDTGTPTPTLCATKMGNGAIFGVGNLSETIYCSLNHALMYPCYCPADFVECLAENNQVAKEGTPMCSINGKTYYKECSLTACPAETPTLAIVSKDTDISESYGPGAISSPCIKEDGTEMLQVMCDSKTYTDPCEYPYEAPKTGNWCKYGSGTTLMKDGKPHYQAGACKVTKKFGECGKEIAGAEDASYTIFVASSESECSSKYGPGIKTQLCEYGEDQGYKRAYNCYYDPTEFKYTTANCGVRHDLTGNYIMINGKKHWNQCNCASAYKHHKFNCGGLLSGNPCQQEITKSLIDSDDSLQDETSKYALEGKTLPFYPYCECSADYTEICDEDGSGRYKGVGTACNGKYQSCECVPDKLPDNWTDNYYGCPGGKKPTGVWKDNGCGKKYYQCTVVECTWEYTEMCEAPLIPVGQSCQDNEGNIGGYKACTCPSEYKTCPTGQIGEGEPCNLKGVSYYKSCRSQEICSSLATETCTGPLQIGINPCTSAADSLTYYEKCICANGYSQVCGEGQVGVGSYCEIDGVKYYKECTEPEKNQCTEGHVVACDTNQESHSPCVGTDANGKQIIKYLCKCPSNWKSCDTGSGESCTQTNSDGSQVTYWSECNSGAATCSAYQELTYKVCTAAQIGEGGSCVSTSSSNNSASSSTSSGDLPLVTTPSEELGFETTVVKYAQCKDSNNCLTNGFRFSCTGYDTSALGESCIDAQGNKLYKSCPCPSNYVSCGNSNATKGSKCVPLLESGVLGETLYSSCECDRSKYKYTCRPEGNNKGIVAPSNSYYCEVEEEVTTTTKDEETGEETTSTKKEKVKYYTSCDCDENYKYTCSNGVGGELLPEANKEDYCLINSTKFYKSCDCSGEYIVTKSDCPSQQGQMVDSSRGSCTIKGTVTRTINTSDGEGGYTTNEVTLSSQTLYKGCICKPNYKLECTNSLYDQTDIPVCTLDETKHLYPKCKCKSENAKTCAKSGKNQGIIPDEASICTEMTADTSGNVSTSPKYTACTCIDDYGIPESICAADEKYNQFSQNYCDSGEDGAEKSYKECYCDPAVYDNSISTDVNDAAAYCADLGKISTYIDFEEQFCLGKVYNKETSNIDSTYHPNKSLCCQDDLGDDWIKIDYNEYSSLQDFYDSYSEEAVKATIKANCGHAYNATIALNCAGEPLYKCSNNTIKTKAASGEADWFSKQECSDLNMGRETQGSAQTIAQSWSDSGKNLQVFPKCTCNAKYKYTDKDGGEDAVCWSYYQSVGGNKSTNRTLFCSDETNYWDNITMLECTQGMFKLHPTEFCIKEDGSRYHTRCVCKQGSDNAVIANSCISDFCGNPHSGDEPTCWVGGLPNINGGKHTRVSVLANSNSGACKSPTSRTEGELEALNLDSKGGNYCNVTAAIVY